MQKASVFLVAAIVAAVIAGSTIAFQTVTASQGKGKGDLGSGTGCIVNGTGFVHSHSKCFHPENANKTKD